MDLDTFEMLELLTLGTLATGKSPGSVSSILKLRVSRLKQAIGALGVELLGSQALRWRPSSVSPASGTLPQTNDRTPTMVSEYLNSRAATIFGGASEIQLGIIAKSVLGEL